MTALPPVATGSIHEMTELVLTFEVADTPVGAPGAVAGIAAADAVDAVEVPDAFVAVTVNVYEVPLVRPATVHVRAPVVVQVLSSGVDVTV